MLNVWVDLRSDAECWTYRFGTPRRIDITVIYGHLAYPKQWVMTCHRLGLETVVLDATSAALAKEAALAAVKDFLKTTLADLTRKPNSNE